MYQGKHSGGVSKQSRAQTHGNRGLLLLLPALLFVALIGGSLAYLLAQAPPVNNMFLPGRVDCEVTEDFDGYEKTDVNAVNTGNTEAFLRIKLIGYRVNEEGQRIGGAAPVPAFTPGSGWVAYGGFYYYTQPVAPGQSPGACLVDSMTLRSNYGDGDGGRQVIEVMAEAIQSAPAEAAGTAWGVRIADGAVSAWQ